MFGVENKYQRYMRQAIESATSANMTNPMLPREIVSDRTVSYPQFTLQSIRRYQPHRRYNVWAKRMMAMVQSPFELTLSMDASVTICSVDLFHQLRLSLMYVRYYRILAYSFPMYPHGFPRYSGPGFLPGMW